MSPVFGAGDLSGTVLAPGVEAMTKRNSPGMISRIVARLTPDTEGSATAMLKSDHRKVEDLFAEFDDAGARQRGRIASRTVEELAVHATLEEEIFYPALEAELEDVRPVECAEEEHGLMKKLLEELAGMTSSAPHFEAKYQVLKEIVRHHVREEEAQIFPTAEATELDLKALGEQMQSRKAELTGRGTREQRREHRSSRGAPKRKTGGGSSGGKQRAAVARGKAKRQG